MLMMRKGTLVERADVQRKRILDAAKTCFSAKGFHGASIAQIAAAAGLSQGLMYRYFENKKAIIQCIVLQQIEQINCHVRQPGERTLAKMVADSYATSRQGSDDIDPALLLEITAEATRDPDVAAALNDHDTFLRGVIQQSIEQVTRERGEPQDDARTARRALLVQLILDGVMVRETREPDLDRTLLHDALKDFETQLLRQD